MQCCWTGNRCCSGYINKNNFNNNGNYLLIPILESRKIPLRKITPQFSENTPSTETSFLSDFLKEISNYIDFGKTATGSRRYYFTY